MGFVEASLAEGGCGGRGPWACHGHKGTFPQKGNDSETSAEKRGSLQAKRE